MLIRRAVKRHGLLRGLASCAVGPDYSPPQAPMPAGFAAAGPKPDALRRTIVSLTPPNGGARCMIGNSIHWSIAPSPRAQRLKIALDRLQQARAQEFVIIGSALPMLGGSEGGGIGTGSDLGRGRAAKLWFPPRTGRAWPDHQSRRLRRRLGNRRIRQISPCHRGRAIRRRSRNCGAQRGADFARRRRNPRLSRFARLANAACGASQNISRLCRSMPTSCRSDSIAASPMSWTSRWRNVELAQLQAEIDR